MKTTLKSTVMSAAILASATTLASGQTDNLLFTTLNQNGAETTASGSSGLNMQFLNSEDVAIVRPNPSGPYSAEKFASEKNWQVTMGDANNDAFFYQSPLFGKIDAILAISPPGVAPTMRDVYVSPSQSLGGPAGRPIEPGDVVSIRPNGTIHAFLKTSQVTWAFDMTGEPNIDAICTDFLGNLFLSFEDDEWILGGTVLAEDGAMLVVPAGGVVYNADGTVGGTAFAAGFVAQSEAQMDARLANSNYMDPNGNPPPGILDLDGLTEDPNGGTFTTQWGGNVWNFPNLLFCGENMTGCGVASTAAGGVIPLINGAPVASNVATTGPRMGVAPNPNEAGSLNGLHRNNVIPCRLIMDSPDVDHSAAAGPVVLEWGGADPFTPVWLWYGIVPRVAGSAAPSSPIGGVCFPNLFVSNSIAFFPSDARGFGSVTGVAGGLGIPVVMQVITNKAALGGLGWSAPILFEL